MEPEELERRRFSREEVGDLIETATRLDHLAYERGLSLDELRSVAAEVGVSDESLVRAVHERLAAERGERERQRLAEQAVHADQKRQADAADEKRLRINRWVNGVGAYVATIGGLAVFDWFSGGPGLDWVWWPAAGWGIAVVADTFRTFFPTGDDEVE